MDSFAQLDQELERLRPTIERHARVLGHPDPELIFQDVLIAYWRHVRRGEVFRNLHGWVRQVVRNAVRAWRRTELRSHTVSESKLGIELDELEKAPSVAAHHGDKLRRAISRLPVQQADIIEACTLGGESLSAYSDRCGTKLETVRTRVKRGIKRLEADAILRVEVCSHRDQ